MQTTTNLGLKKPEGTDVVNIDDLNYNTDKLDTEIINIKNGTTKVGAASTSDNATKLAAARTISLTGDTTGSVTFDGSANSSITTTLATVATAGTYKSVTVDAKGRVTSGTNPTTLAGYGIIDGVNSSDVVTTATANKILKLDANSKLPASITGNADGNAGTATKLQTVRTISLTGDAAGSASFDGSANATITTTLKNTGTTGTYTKVTTDAQGRVVSGTIIAATDIPSLDWSKITSGKPITLSGYGITDAVSSSQLGQSGGAAKQDDFVTHLADDVNHIPYAVTTGSANTYTVTLNPAPTSYIDGMAICVKINVASTGASTLNVNGLGAKTILDSLGNAITSGGLKAGVPYTLRYNGTNFIVQGKGGGGNTVTSHVLAGETCTVDTGQITGTMTNRANTKFQICGYENITEIIPHPSDPNGQGLITGLNAYGATGYIDSNSQIQMSVMNLIPANIKTGVNVGRNSGSGTQIMTGTFTSDATATASQILSGKTAYVNGNKITGTMVNHSNTGIGNTGVGSTSGEIWLSVPDGYYYASNVNAFDSNFIPANIVNGKSIFGLTGTAISGYRVVSGSLTTPSGGVWDQPSFTVSGIGFTPKIVFWCIDTNNVAETGSQPSDMTLYSDGSLNGYTMNFMVASNAPTNPVHVTSDGFWSNVSSGTLGGNIYWTAIG